MDTNLLDIKFARIGARLKVADRPARRSRTPGVISLDVQADRKGEFFEIVRQPGAEAEIAVLDVQPADRHLLLLVREGKDKSKFLCGHDERHWFVAGIPETAPVGTVRQAKEALKPAEVLTAQAGKRLKAKARSVEVDLQLEEKQPPDVLYHGTVERFIASIMEEGLKKGKRHHVHLSKDMETARKVGARRGKPVILQVDAGKLHGQGFKFFLSVNGVWLTDSVPAAFLTRM